jgi:hypothetical protein
MGRAGYNPGGKELTMNARLHALLALFGCGLLLGTSAVADETGELIRFAAPKRIMAGDAVAGAGRLYPSPVMHDMDGDGKLDLVVGDLFGNVTVARRSDDGFAKEEPLLDRDGKPLKFHNW